MNIRLILLVVVLFGSVLIVCPTQAREMILDTPNTSMIEMAKGSLNPLQYKNPQQMIGVVIRGLLAFVGSISIILYVFAGVLWMTAAGNDEKVKKATAIFIWTTLGVTVMLGSYVIVQFLFGNKMLNL